MKEIGEYPILLLDECVIGTRRFPSIPFTEYDTGESANIYDDTLRLMESIIKPSTRSVHIMLVKEV